MSPGVEAEHVRPATSEDLEALTGLERASFDAPWPRASLAAELAKATNRTWLLETASTIVAYACFQCVADEAELLRIAVHVDHRRQGYGDRLFRHAFEALTQIGVTQCHLEVRADNTAALALYRHHGFVESGRRAGYYGDGMDALMLSVRLAVGNQPSGVGASRHSRVD